MKSKIEKNNILKTEKAISKIQIGKVIILLNKKQKKKQIANEFENAFNVSVTKINSLPQRSRIRKKTKSQVTFVNKNGYKYELTTTDEKLKEKLGIE